MVDARDDLGAVALERAETAAKWRAEAKGADGALPRRRSLLAVVPSAPVGEAPGRLAAEGRTLVDGSVRDDGSAFRMGRLGVAGALVLVCLLLWIRLGADGRSRKEPRR